jgi:hypothetical protein
MRAAKANTCSAIRWFWEQIDAGIQAAQYTEQVVMLYGCEE